MSGALLTFSSQVPTSLTSCSMLPVLRVPAAASPTPTACFGCGSGMARRQRMHSVARPSGQRGHSAHAHDGRPLPRARVQCQVVGSALSGMEERRGEPDGAIGGVRHERQLLNHLARDGGGGGGVGKARALETRSARARYEGKSNIWREMLALNSLGVKEE